jgi:excinuclease ABC subunit C
MDGMAEVTTKRAARLIDEPELLRERLRAAPESAGVYLMRDLEARVMYVGKAANLRSRLRSYFAGLDSLALRTRQLVDRVFDFEVIACLNEREALILENTLIKRYRPRFNVRLKDDKNYLYLKIPRPGMHDVAAPGTAREEERLPRGEASARATLFPRPYYSRRMARDGARYFGPYTSAQSLRTTVKSLRAIFPFRTCSDEIFRRGRVCLDYHIKRCSGPCEGLISADDYGRLLDQVEMFMEGRSAVLTAQLRNQMEDAAAHFDYEAAARHRDRLRAIDRISQRQKMIHGGRKEQDCLAIALEGGRGMVAVLSVREAKVTGLETYELEGVADLAAGACLGSFVSQYYGSATQVPRTVLVSDALDDPEVLADFLTAQRGGPVDLRVPQRGPARELVEQARETARTGLGQARIKADFDADRTEALLADLQVRLDLPELPRRIECYDISNTMGTNSVGSMVVFEDGRPRSGHYRHFGIRTVEGSNDVASMQETLRRRFTRYLRAAAEEGVDDVAQTGGDVAVDDPAGSNGALDGGGAEPGVAESGNGAVAGGARGRRRRRPSAAAEDSFGILPDLVLIDGGKGQLSAAREVMAAAGLSHIPTFGLAKRNEELFRPDAVAPILIPHDSPTLFLLQRVRDEAHRFAITRHRARRGKAALRSRLDIVPGLGPVRRRALLRRFGSIDGIREATVDELMSVPGIPRTVALRLKELL